MKMSRRHFLKNTGRAAAVSGLSLMLFRVFRRNTILSPESCVNNSICNGCGVLSNCVLPPALSRRSAEEGSG